MNLAVQGRRDSEAGAIGTHSARRPAFHRTEPIGPVHPPRFSDRVKAGHEGRAARGLARELDEMMSGPGRMLLSAFSTAARNEVERAWRLSASLQAGPFRVLQVGDDGLRMRSMYDAGIRR